jgi:hypothetical protein
MGSCTYLRKSRAVQHQHTGRLPDLSGYLWQLYRRSTEGFCQVATQSEGNQPTSGHVNIYIDAHVGFPHPAISLTSASNGDVPLAPGCFSQHRLHPAIKEHVCADFAWQNAHLKPWLRPPTDSASFTMACSCKPPCSFGFLKQSQVACPPIHPLISRRSTPSNP